MAANRIASFSHLKNSLSKLYSNYIKVFGTDFQPTGVEPSNIISLGSDIIRITVVIIMLRTLSCMSLCGNTAALLRIRI